MVDQSKRLAFFVTSMEGGGAERVMLNLVNHYAKQGYQVDLLLANKIGPYLAEVSSEVRIVDLKTTRFWTYFLPLMRYFRQEKPEVILVATTILNILSLVAKKMSFSSARVVISEHIAIGSFAETGNLQRAGLLKYLIRWIYPWADQVVAVSDGAADGLASFSGLNRNSIKTIYNGVVDEEKLNLAKQPLVHPWINDESLKVLLAVGRLEAQKDYPNLLNAFSQVLNQSHQHQPKLIVLGEGELRSSLEKLIADLEIGEHVALPGFVDNPFQYLSHADLFVLSSEFEGLPTVLIEALACGCSVVSTDCPSGPREILADGKYGVLVPVSDNRALANAIIERLQNEDPCPIEQRKQRGQSFSVSTAVENYSQVLGLRD